VNEMVKAGEVKPEEAPDIVDRLVSRGEQDREEMRKLVRDELEKLKIQIPVASHADIEELNQKIDELAAKVEELAGEKTQKPARTRKTTE
jgi:polyhydroxyalkanoate synthesis regulator phasin